MRWMVLTVLTVVALASGLAIAADDPIAARQALMKANDAASRTAFGMALGRAPFDATAAADAMKKIADDMTTFPTLFPEGSDKGDTHASPSIWSNMDDFKALAAKLQTDATAAATAAANGLDAFKAALAPISDDCRNCHRAYKL